MVSSEGWKIDSTVTNSMMLRRNLVPSTAAPRAMGGAFEDMTAGEVVVSEVVTRYQSQLSLRQGFRVVASEAVLWHPLQSLLL